MRRLPPADAQPFTADAHGPLQPIAVAPHATAAGPGG